MTQRHRYATPDGELDPATAPAPVLPTYWQCAPCPACGQKSWAVPWEPRAVCLRCNGPLQVVEVYLPTNPQGSAFVRRG